MRSLHKYSVLPHIPGWAHESEYLEMHGDIRTETTELTKLHKHLFGHVGKLRLGKKSDVRGHRVQRQDQNSDLLFYQI